MMNVDVRDLRTARARRAARPGARRADERRARPPRARTRASVDAFGRCVLGHRRLQVIDLATGSQPVANETGDVVAVFNGELYNFRELRARALRGHEVRGTGDTPVIPHLYEEHGVGFVERLDGMFAIALWDAGRERLVLARDRVGKKPLLWTRLPDGTLAFASELKALLRLPGVSRELDPAALDAYLALQYVPARNGPARHREAAARARARRRGRRRSRVEPYWRLEPRRAARRGRVARARARDGRRGGPQAARRRRPARRAPLRRDRLERRRRGDGAGRRARCARSPSASATTATTSGPTRGRSPSATGPSTRRSSSSPTSTDLLPRLAAGVRRAARRRGGAAAATSSRELARRHVTVALTGDGGDEAFAGYERYAAVGLAGRVAMPGAGLGGAGAAPGRARRAALAREPRGPPPRGRRAARLGALRAADGGLPGATARRALGAGVRRASRCLPGSCSARAATGIAELQRLDVRTYLPGDLLLKADIASMAHSLELRSPLLDHEVLELGVSLPDTLKVEGRRGKVALRRAFADALPPEVVRPREDGLRRPDLALVPRRAARARRRRAARRARPRARPAAARRRSSGCSTTTPRAAPTTATGSGACSCSSSGSASTSTPRFRPRSRVRTRPWLLVALVAAVPRLVVLLHERNDILTSFTEKSDDLARVFVHSGTFGFIPGEPTAWTQPLYAWFLIPIYWIFGRSWWAVGLIQIGGRRRRPRCSIYEIGRRFVSRKAGVIAAVIATLNPYLVWHDVHENREILDQLLAAAIVLGVLALWQRRSLWLGALLGRAARPGDPREHAPPLPADRLLRIPGRAEPPLLDPSSASCSRRLC